MSALMVVVRVTGFEPAASCSQSTRATNCATPGYSILDWLYGRNSYGFVRPPLHRGGFHVLRTCNPGCCLDCSLLILPQAALRCNPQRGALPTALHPDIRFWIGFMGEMRTALSAADSRIRRPCERRIHYSSFMCVLQAFYRPTAAFSASTRSVFSQRTCRSSRPI